MADHSSARRAGAPVPAVALQGSPAAAAAGGSDGAPHLQPGEGTLSWSFDAGDALAGRRVRHALVDLLRAFGYDLEARFAAELAFGELIGNVVRHCGGPVEVWLDTSRHEGVLHVLDRGRGFKHAPRLPDEDLAEGGRGLHLIDAMVGDFSVADRPGGGSHVRVVLRR
jgi:anti-sigma regulatory factor (Ser/Thr protein kinase)